MDCVSGFWLVTKTTDRVFRLSNHIIGWLAIDYCKWPLLGYHYHYHYTYNNVYYSLFAMIRPEMKAGDGFSGYQITLLVDLLLIKTDDRVSHGFSISLKNRGRFSYIRKHPLVINDWVGRHVTNKNLRNNIKLGIPLSKTNAGKQIFRHRAPIIWNSLSKIAKAS